MMKIYLKLNGMEQFAKGGSLYSWHFTCITDEDEFSKPETGAVLIATTGYTMPSKAECIPPLLAKLAKREAEIRAEAANELKEVQQRKNDLLMLEAPSND